MTCQPERTEDPVTRMEIVDHLGEAFVAGAATRADLLGMAARSGARNQLLAVLQAVPDPSVR